MNKRHILFICIAVIAAILTVVLAGGRKGNEVVHEEKIEFRLNDTLTNEMSEIPELKGLDKKMRSYLIIRI